MADGGAATSAPLPAIATLSRCCAQFVVSRERVTARPRAFYREALARLIDAHDAPDDGRADDNASAGPPGAAAPPPARARDDADGAPAWGSERARAASRRWGLLFEWLWHYILGEAPVAPELAYLAPRLGSLGALYLDGDSGRAGLPACLAPPTAPAAAVIAAFEAEDATAPACAEDSGG